MSSLSSTSIQRPVLATVMAIAIVLFGFIGLSYLGIREYPSVDPPIVTVSTSYIGANANIVESQITEVVEESVNRYRRYPLDHFGEPRRPQYGDRRIQPGARYRSRR